MPWIFFAVISIFSMAVANLFTRVLMKNDKSDAVASAIIFQFLNTFITAIFALWKGFHLPEHTYFISFILSAVLYGLASIYMFKAVKYLEASEAAILTPIGTIITIIASLLLLHEVFTLPKIIGTALVLLSVTIISKSKKLILNKGFLYALASTILAGIAVTNDAYILKSYDAISYSVVMSFLPGVVILLLQPKAVYKFKTIFSGNNFRNMVLLGFFYSIQVITYYLALGHGAGSSQMAPIFKANIILTVILAILFLRERDHLGIKFVSAILVTAGVLLLSVA